MKEGKKHRTYGDEKLIIARKMGLIPAIPFPNSLKTDCITSEQNDI